MDLSIFAKQVIDRVKANSPEILTALSVSGVVSTAYLAHKAGTQTTHRLESESPYLSVKEKALMVWKFYIPTGVSGALTVACIIGASKASGRRTTAAVAAYSLTERAFAEYREKVIEQVGEARDQKIKAEIAQDTVNRDQPGSREIIIAGSGHILCCELYTHRYFRSDMEALRRAQNDINAKIVNSYYVTLDDFYDIIGLPHTSASDKLGWDTDKLMELQFSTVLSQDGDPCLAFDYNYVKPLK